MTLNELIIHLEVLYQEHGNIPVYFSEEGRWPELLDEDDVNFREGYSDQENWHTYPNHIEIGQS